LSESTWFTLNFERDGENEQERSSRGLAPKKIRLGLVSAGGSIDDRLETTDQDGTNQRNRNVSTMDLFKTLFYRWPKAGLTALLGFAALSTFLAGTPAFAQNDKPVATLELQQVQVALLWSATLGGGTLNFKGKAYKFTVGGLGIGGIGASSINATGEVFNMTDPKQIEGVYGQARYGYAAGTDSGGALWMQNPNGVRIKLNAQRTGLALSLGADGVAIMLD
jgi:hypothetical protein